MRPTRPTSCGMTRVCTRATLPHAGVCRTRRHAVPTEPVYGVHMYGRVQGGSGGRLGAMLICMRRHDGRHRSSGGCATNGTEGSEGKHRSLSPVHPRHPPPPPARLSRPSRPSRLSPRSPTRAATRSPHVLRLSLFLSPSLLFLRRSVLDDFPRFLSSIRHGVIFPSCSVSVAAFFLGRSVAHGLE